MCKAPAHAETLLLLLFLLACRQDAAAQYGPSQPSIREQLEGRVEKEEDQDELEALKARLDREKSLMHSGRLQSGQLGAGDHAGGPLQGRVQERDQLEKLYRPFNGDPLGKQVKVLSGRNYRQLEAQTANDTFDSVLSANNFNLSSSTSGQSAYKPLNPQSAYKNLNNVSVDMQSGRHPGRRGSSWSRSSDWYFPYDPPWGGIGWGNRNFDRGWEFGYDDFFHSSGNPSMEWNSFNIRRSNSIGSIGPSAISPFPLRQHISPIRPLNLNPGWSMPAKPAPLYDEKNISWDAWYQRISRALYQNWTGRGKEPGDAVLRITVRRPRQIQADFVKCNNPKASFKSDLLSAVSSLNGNPILDFPGDSQKQVVSFDSQFSAGTDTRAGAYSERFGELEKIRRRR